MGAPIFEEIPKHFITEVKKALPDRQKLIQALERGDANEITQEFAKAMSWNLDPEHIFNLVVDSKNAELVDYLSPYMDIKKFRQRWEARDFGPTPVTTS